MRFRMGVLTRMACWTGMLPSILSAISGRIGGTHNSEGTASTLDFDLLEAAVTCGNSRDSDVGLLQKAA